MTTSFKPQKGEATLRKKVLTWAFAVAVSVLIAVGFLMVWSLDARSDLARATDSFVEEQRMADRIHRGVMRQLTGIAVVPAGDRERTRDEFWVAGEEVHHQIRRYLFRDLSLEQRVHLEEMAEEHQRLEVAAAQATDLVARGLASEAEGALETMVTHAFHLLDGMEAFLQIREAELEALRSRQDTTVQLLMAGVGLLSLLVMVATLMLWWILDRRVAVPLGVLALASERIATGDLEARVPEGPDGEFQRVAQAFNRMAESLQKAQDDIQERNAELQDALTTLREAQSELIQSEKLSAMGRMPAGVAHELNNPLASVMGYGQLLDRRLEEEGPLSPQEVQERFLAPLLEEAGRAQRLVRNFLRFSRRSEVELRPIPLREALGVVEGLREHAFRQEGLELVVDEVPDVHVRADADMLQSMILNVVNNALDAMRPQGRGTLRISGREEEGTVRLTFQDQGPGFSDPERAMEPFFTTKPVGEGTGLGLALVYRFVSLFGGVVHLENAPAGGARLEVTLPVVVQPQVEGEKGETEHPTVPVDTVPVDVENGGEKPGSQGRSRRILVVEDEAPLRDLQKRLLERLDATVVLTGTVDEAQAVLGEEEVDAVLSDVKMPGESGLELYRWVLRTRPELSGRFLFVTGDVSQRELVELSERAPELFIHKPFDVGEYLSRVSALLE